MVIKRLRSEEDIALAIEDVRLRYDQIAAAASADVPRRTWQDVAEEHLTLFSRLR